MSDWDASDSEPIVVLPAKKTWDDEDVDDEIKESWEDSEDEKPKVVAAPKKKVPLAQKIAEREAKEKEEKAKKLLEAKADKDLSAQELKERREAQRRLQEEADLQNAADLFGDVAIKDTDKELIKENSSIERKLESLAESSLKTKEDFEKYSSLLAQLILNHKANRQYTGFVESLVRDITEPLKDVDLRKMSSALSAAANEKQRAAKAALKGKSKGVKKSNVRVDNDIVSTASAAKAGVFDDDDEFDDFM
ncbi:Translation initiation factor 3 subunit J component [Entomophthora muscae]|uniref:Translation initiation factor 3 subunit J component n=1 Tax=Entomophthora muscae TaxID=34485 RepID=A0ACC2UTL3_9FUNG|nr:Translation initiation factor 3 subunit J component [Entomophthora muscae]